jgi:hypothetical protein
MKKLLKLVDDNILKFGVVFAILFTALYPKLPSVHIERTWVYIRLEDFVILSLAIIWVIQLLRRKVSLPKPEGYAIVLYWIAGLASLLYCLAFIAPHLQNFFPTIAGFQYVRRIEYMILFFIAFSTVRNIKDVYFYITTLCITVLGIVIYGFGQRFYLTLWNAFPDFFQKYPFCFPAFLTGNEEFAKGVPLCLTETSRINATFGGHYDLSAYMVLVIPILVALFFAVKRWKLKVTIFILAILALDILNFTSSRTSFAAYIMGVTATFLFWNKKRWIIPVLIVSIGAMTLSSDATIKRFAKTVQQVQVVSTSEELPSDLKDIIAKTKKAEEIKSSEVPPASDFTVGATSASASSSGGYKTILTDEQLQKLTFDELAISTVSGSFLIQKAYALDISFTTRFQAEWPRNWTAFLFSPIFGTGYSSLTLATDNDYLRALGETGLVGTLSFLFIFVVLGIFMKNSIPSVKDDVTRGFLFGLAGGVVGLLVNAVLIDVFEASKVAEPLWILLGIGVGAGSIYKKHPINYKGELRRFFTSRFMVLVYLLIIILTAFGGSINNFFVADDFTWLKWAATASPNDIPRYFVDAQNFFYRPLDKTVVYLLYQVFAFMPQGYHLFTLLVHFVTVIGVYYVASKLFKNKLLGFLTATLFALHPVHHENIFWFSTISVTMSAMFIIHTVNAYLRFRENKSIAAYITAIILSILAFLTYEISVIIPLLFVAVDIFITKPKITRNVVFQYVPFILMVPLYFAIREASHAFVSGGDYAYKLVNLPFNFVGNYLGYISLFLGGNGALPGYTMVRDTLRQQPLIAAVIIGIAGVILLIIWYSMRKKLSTVLKNRSVLLVLFGLVFAAVSLLPFLGLGNIAPRYFYLASFGFALAFIVLLHYFLSAFLQHKHKYAAAILIVIVSLLSAWYIKENTYMANEWGKAGIITKSVLKIFQIDNKNLSNTAQVYFAGAPLKYHDVWLFPVGLKDALWFIYRANSPVIHHVDTVEEAKDKIGKEKTPENLIFKFDKEGAIERVQ